MAVAVGLLTGCASREAKQRTEQGEVVVTERRGRYFEVIVVEGDDGLRRLRFERDGVDQSAVRVGDPDRLIFAYMRALPVAFAVVPEPERILVVGLGGGSFPMFARRHLPEAWIDVAELEPRVLEVAEEFLGFKRDKRMRVTLGDGRAFVEGSEARWDVIVLDAYGADNVPARLATREFYTAVREHVAPGGVVVANVWGDGSNADYRSMLRTFEATFPEVHVLAPAGSDSRIVMAFGEAQGLGQADLAARAAALEARWGVRLGLGELVRRGHAGPGMLPPGGAVLEDGAAAR